MLTPERLQQIIALKDVENVQQDEGWAICDGALVAYDLDDPPAWFRFPRDEDGNSVKPDENDDNRRTLSDYQARVEGVIEELEARADINKAMAERYGINDAPHRRNADMDALRGIFGGKPVERLNL